MSEKQSSKIKKNTWIYLVSLVLLSAAVFSLYRFMIYHCFFEAALISYMAIETIFVLAYVIYNRGFSRRGITTEMLPESWSDEEKAKFIESGVTRFEKSKWMLIVILAFLLTFLIDMIELWIIPFLLDVISSL